MGLIVVENIIVSLEGSRLNARRANPAQTAHRLFTCLFCSECASANFSKSISICSWIGSATATLSFKRLGRTGNMHMTAAKCKFGIASAALGRVHPNNSPSVGSTQRAVGCAFNAHLSLTDIPQPSARPSPTASHRERIHCAPHLTDKPHPSGRPSPPAPPTPHHPPGTQSANPRPGPANCPPHRPA